MYNSDVATTRKMREVELKLKNLYSDAYAQLQAESDIYFHEFESRYKKQYEAYKQGKYTEQEFKAWYASQVARGERWEALRDDMARKVTAANVEAAKIMNAATPEVFESNYNWSAYEVEKATGIAFNVHNEQTVKQLMKDNPELLPRKGVNVKKDELWNRQKLNNAVASGILTGKSIDKISSSFQQVTNMNWTAAVRNARTAVTAAQNSGKQQQMEDIEPFAKANGLDIKKEWVSANDDRVRDSHAELNGVRVDVDDIFPNGLMYPGDPDGEPAEVYNCRCSQRTVINGISASRTDKTPASYEKWQKERLAAQEAKKAKSEGRVYDIFYDKKDGADVSLKTEAKTKITVTESWNNLPQKVRTTLKDTTFVMGYDHPACEVEKMRIRVYDGITQEEVHHEVGHLVEEYMMPKEAVDNYKQRLAMGLGVNDIYQETYIVDGEEVDLYFLNSPIFVSQYQSRLYINKPSEGINPDGTINIDKLGETISEPFAFYMNGKTIPDDVQKLIEDAVL